MTTMTLKQVRDKLSHYGSEYIDPAILDAIDAELKRQSSAQGEAAACHRLLWKASRGDWQAPGPWADDVPSMKLVDDIAQQSSAPLRWKLEVVYAHPVERAGVPDGWKLVPVEPTPFMVGEGAWAYRQVDATVADVWKAMLAAAPVVFTDDGSSEAQHVADAERLNCPACGGSGHVDDVRAAERAGVPDGCVVVRRWKLERAAKILERDGDEYGIGNDLRAMLAAAPSEAKP